MRVRKEFSRFKCGLYNLVNICLSVRLPALQMTFYARLVTSNFFYVHRSRQISNLFKKQQYCTIALGKDFMRTESLVCCSRLSQGNLFKPQQFLLIKIFSYILFRVQLVKLPCKNTFSSGITFFVHFNC